MATPSRFFVARLAIGLALVSSSAHAGGIGLRWDDCGAAGSQVRTFACNTNSGEHTLVASFIADAPIPDVVGVDLRLEIFSDFTIDDWWQLFNAGGCRSVQPRVDVVGFPGSCGDFWAGQASGGGGIGSYLVDRRRASLLMAWATPQAGPVDDVTEYYALNIRIDNSKTVGDPACAGCSIPKCLYLAVIAIAHGPQGSLSQVIDHSTAVWDSNVAYWQNQPVLGCYVPTVNRSWGQIKSMYR